MNHIKITYQHPYESNPNEIECWMPIKLTEPSNKKTPEGYWDFRTENTQGGYFHIFDSDNYLHIKERKAFVKTHELVEPVFVFGTHYSHLCHHWWCINPTHIELEPDWVNIMRKSCIYWKKGNKSCVCNQVIHPLFPTNWKPKKCIWSNEKYRKQFPTKTFIEDDPKDFIESVKTEIEENKDLMRLFNPKKIFDEIWNIVSKWL